MRAISIHQPWAWAIFHAGKNVENRSRGTLHRGPLAIHASKGLDPAEYQAAAREIWRITGTYAPPPEELLRGVVLGTVDIVDCVRDSQSPWAMRGCAHWLLENARPLASPLPQRGQQGMFNVEGNATINVSGGKSAGDLGFDFRR